jgi:hypothetical protein
MRTRIIAVIAAALFALGIAGAAAATASTSHAGAAAPATFYLSLGRSPPPAVLGGPRAGPFLFYAAR